MRIGELGLIDPARASPKEYEASISVAGPRERQIVPKQVHQSPDASEIRTLQLGTRKKKDECMGERLEQVKNSLPTRTKRAVKLATENGASNWLIVIPINLNKREFSDAIKLRYDWEITDTQRKCVYVREPVQRRSCNGMPAGRVYNTAHNELRNLEAEMLSMVCNHVELESFLQEIT